MIWSSCLIFSAHSFYWCQPANLPPMFGEKITQAVGNQDTIGFQKVIRILLDISKRKVKAIVKACCQAVNGDKIYISMNVFTKNNQCKSSIYACIECSGEEYPPSIGHMATIPMSVYVIHTHTQPAGHHKYAITTLICTHSSKRQ